MVVDVFVEQGPSFIALLVDSLDELYRDAETEGIDLEEDVRGTMALAKKLTASETVEVFSSMLNS